MYVKIINNCIAGASETEKEGYSYIATNYKDYVNNLKKKRYKIGKYGILLKNNLPEIREDSSEFSNKNKNNNKEVNRKEKALEAIKEHFEKSINMNIKWKNGQYYKPRYASENYEPLLAANKILELQTQGQKSLLPKEIWDATKLNSDVMTAAELQELALYLATIYEKQFQEYKKAYKKVLEGN